MFCQSTVKKFLEDVIRRSFILMYNKKCMEQDKDIQEAIKLIADISSLQAKYLNNVREQTLVELEDIVG